MGDLISIGGVAKRLNISPSTVRLWERRGLIPPATRLEGSDRRVWRAGDLVGVGAGVRPDTRRDDTGHEPAPTAA